MAKRPEKPCTSCGKRTTAVSQKCRDCTTPPPAYTEYDRLEGGRWEYRGLVAYWVADDADAA